MLVALTALILRGRAEPSAPRAQRRPAAPVATTAKLERTATIERDRAPTAAPAQLTSIQAPAEPTPALRAAFERESPDASAHTAEARLRAIYAAERDADIILRDVRCTRSVCKLDLRWSPDLNKPYNDALNRALKEFSRDIDLTPAVPLDTPQLPIPMTLYIARPGHSIATLLAEQR